ncbi:ribosomal protein S12 methylthiotransferase RimO [Dissulfurispira thermophila]|uniref:Ribosomal protein uS12 methylthiotransferase RimO n=1 Tax=Dissulfurispira thermophila TaxID=2715679 RepID=A0A7G1H3N0_9BACT|nr:30S ribosomal protein S12 methylthiotransferase RimO [Dissulfurispira thermophila]BCB96761.1 ribosomal protein S12 methylthiotransferase RimO [Dissulfurispira thermophila]
MTKINITTLGCPKNIVDSGHLARRFASERFLYVDNPNNADIILINTCGFIRDAKEESIEEILKLSKFKTQSSKRLIVFGCLAKRYKDELVKEIPEIDAIFGVGEDSSIIEYCKGLARGERQNTKDKKQSAFSHDPLTISHPLSYRPSSIASSYAYLKIAEGCDKKCTFCVIPSIRGRFRSIQPEKILKEAREHIKNGIRELIIVAQDITKYGKEFENYNLVSLLKDIASIKGDFRIRLLYLYPTEITDELLELIAKEEKIQKYLDIPLQHSEDKILRAMGRRGTRREYIKLIRNIRRTIPGVALRTTFILGFPGETEEDFYGLADFIEEIRFDRLGVFKYSREEGTVASKLKGQVPEKLKNRRLDEIMRRQSLISLEKNKELIGKRYEAIIDEIDDNFAIARLYSHAPEIDGVVIIEKIKDRSQKSEIRIGDLVTVEIVDAFDYDLKAILTPE